MNATHAQRVLFTDVMVFDGTGSARFPGQVLVEGNRIRAVARAGESLDGAGTDTDAGTGTRTGTDTGAAARASAGADAVIVRGNGATLMPGLVEAHAHLTWPSSVGNVVNAMRMPVEEHLLTTAYNARVLLDHGFTSAYSAGSLGERFEIALRNEINAGRIPGPRLRASSIEKGAEGVMGVPGSHDSAHARDLQGLRAYVAKMAEAGADSIKFLLSSDEGFQPGGAQMLLYSEEEVAAIGEQARESGVWLACHAQAAEAVKCAVRNGFRCIFHCTYADEEALDMMEAKKNDIFFAPAPGLLYARAHEAQNFGIGPEQARRMGAVSGLELMQKVCPELHKRGVRVLPGGDYGFPYNPIGRNARDLELFVKLFGYTPTEALVAATKLGGELMDMDLGQVRAGFLADLLLVDGDPTSDVTLLQDQSNLRAIMKDGRFHKSPPLEH
jgi:imidazolonepropionase-like amidohydrolase